MNNRTASVSNYCFQIKDFSFRNGHLHYKQSSAKTELENLQSGKLDSENEEIVQRSGFLNP